MITDNSKTSLLVSALEERYRSIHIIRDRIQTICLWALGIMLAATGWLIQSGICLPDGKKIEYILIISIAAIVLRFFFLADLHRGFRSQQQIAARIEDALGFYDSNYFIKTGTVYPENWKDSGTKNGAGKYFRSTYALLYLGVVLLVFAILTTKGCFIVL